MRRKTLKEFKNTAQKKHNYFYTYLLTDYKNNHTKVKIICPKHGEFLQSPKKHLSGQGCPKCGIFKSGIARRSNSLEFIKKSNKIHNKFYNYSKVNYISDKIKVEIICYKHGSFWQTPNTHKRGRGCIKCKGEKLSLLFRKGDNFKDNAKKVHNNFYKYENTKYINNRVPVEIICPKHGKFKQRPDNHLNGKGCLKCCQRISKKCDKWLSKFSNIEREKAIRINNKLYIVDGFKNNTIYEFFGDFWHGNPKKFRPQDVNPINKIKFGDLYRSTIKRIDAFKGSKYKIVYIWEYEWDREDS